MRTSDLLGRQPELRRIEEFLSPTGSRRLLITGPPGIGKSALVDEAVALARRRGPRVLRAVSSAAESSLPYATLQQLLQPALGRLGRLPEPQRAAVETAFGLRTSDIP